MGGSAAQADAQPLQATGARAPVGGSSAPGTTGQSRQQAGASSSPGAGSVVAGVNAQGQSLGRSCPTPKSTIKLGHVGTYTGAAGTSYKGADVMAQVWAKDVNARGGVSCHPVQIFVANDDGNPARTKSIITDMVENKGVIAFISPLLPLSLSGMTPYLEEHKIPAVGGDGLSGDWWQSPMLFPQTSYFADLAVDVARISVRSYNKPKIGVFVCREVPGCGEAKTILTDPNNQKRGGYQVVNTADVSLTQPDFTAECLSAQNAGAQMLWLGLDAGSVSRVAHSCGSQNYFPLIGYVATGLQLSLADDPDIRDLASASGVFPFISDDFPAAHDFQVAAKKYAPDLALNGMAAQVWAGGKLFEYAARNLPDNPTSADIVAGLYTVNNETLGGLVPPLTFTRGQLPGRSACYFTLAIHANKFATPAGTAATCPS